MLKQRVITALILAPLVISSVLLLPTGYVALLLAVVVLVGSREWARLSGFADLLQQLLYTLLMLLLLGCSYFLMPPSWIPLITGLAVVWWCFVLVRIMRYRSDQSPSDNSLLKGLEGIVVLLPPWLALINLHQIPAYGPGLMLFVLMLIWSADVGAYFAGHRWGSHKLAPEVSPGKTREGVYGAMVSALLCGFVLIWWLDSSVLKSILILLLCLVTMLSSVVGDLFESLLKRQRGMKDSGTLLPGHGGMLDRIDSLTAAAPVFLFGLILLGEA
ncbi:MAG: phosphatidate cytidylyltransferase [Candidatus Thiodiazotropha endolucinida]|nr:phosphatidate cytidylyltransferase [Candidatus Thiodiazotropha taylori]MCW4314587.1 phosphatidate cytidylyltransferase [Candidatus Thiodiazotropha taylori]